MKKKTLIQFCILVQYSVMCVEYSILADIPDKTGLKVLNMEQVAGCVLMQTHAILHYVLLRSMMLLMVYIYAG